MSYPVLYSATETNFDHNGIGILSDCVSYEVVAEGNGAYDFTMLYPMDGIHFDEITDRSIIKAKFDQFVEPQRFRVKTISKPMSGIVTVYAEHISYDLSGIPVSPFSADNVAAALAGLKNNAVVDCPFEFWTDKATQANFKVSAPASIRSRLGGVAGSILDVYGGEYEFDNYTVKLHNSRGQNRGVSIRYGKNLTDIQQEQNCASVATGVYPYWAGDVNGNTVLVELPEKIVNAPGTYNFVKIRTLDLSSEFETQPTVEQLRSKTESYIKANNIAVPSVSLTVSFAQLEQTEEYKHLKLLERVSLFDTVNVEFPALGVSATARAVKIVYDGLADRVKSVTLGSVRSNIADTIANQQQEIQKAPTKSDLERARDAATAWLTNGKGYKVERRDASGNVIDTLYMDTPDINTAVNILRIGQSGIGFSHTGVNGPYLSAWTIDGHFNADFMTTGTLNAALVKVINLIADHLLSIKGNSQLEIDGASINFKMNGKETLDIRNWDDGVPFIYMTSYDASGNIVNRGQFGADRASVGGTWANPEAALTARQKLSNGTVAKGSQLLVDEITENPNDPRGLKFTGETAFPDGVLVGSGTSPIKEIRVGVCHLSCSSKTTVKFSIPMTEGLFTPMVVLTPFTSTAGVIAAKVTAADNTGFTAVIGGSGFSDIYFNYIAFAYP